MSGKRVVIWVTVKRRMKYNIILTKVRDIFFGFLKIAVTEPSFLIDSNYIATLPDD